MDIIAIVFSYLNKFMKYILVVILLCSCISYNPCMEQLDEIKIVNDSYKRIGGIQNIYLSQNEISEFCKLLENSRKIRRKNIRINQFIIDIYINGNTKPFYGNFVEIVNLEENNNILILGSYQYKNEKLVKFIFNKLKI